MTQTSPTTSTSDTQFIRLPHPHCIALYLEFVAQETTLIPSKAACDMSFQSEDETRVLSIKAGQQFYLARSESCTSWWYIIALVTFRGERVWRCTCPAHKPCKHERGAQPVIAAQAQAAQEREAELRKLEEAAARELVECKDCGAQLARSKATCVQDNYYRCPPCRAEARIEGQAAEWNEIGIRFDMPLHVELTYKELGLPVATPQERKAHNDKRDTVWFARSAEIRRKRMENAPLNGDHSFRLMR